MIKNILFDMGGVLIRYEPRYFVKRLGLPEEDELMLYRETFKSIEWVRTDRGQMTDEEAQAGMKSRLPERLHKYVELLQAHWNEPPEQIAGMQELVEELTEKGYKVCLLTNASHRQRTYWKTYPISEYFGDRVVLSAEEGVTKPSSEFFERALKKLDLKREECVFIDDTPSNADGAEQVGIKGIVFHGDAALLRIRLREIGVDVRA